MATLNFLLYDNRSGSTLLCALLNQYRGIAVAQEVDFVNQVLEYPGQLNSFEDVCSLLDYLYGNTRLAELNVDREEVEARLQEENSLPKQAEVIRVIAATYFANSDPEAEYWLLKDPRLYFHLRTLQKQFPESKFIQIVRDGRAVYNSKCSSHSVFTGRTMDENLINAALRWRKKLSLAERHMKAIYTIRYEDVVLQTEKAMQAILNHLGVSKQGRVRSKSQSDYVGEISESYRELHPNVSRNINVDRVNGWYQRLSPEDIYLYEWLNKVYLRQFGYELVETARSHRLTFRARVALKAVLWALRLVASKCEVLGGSMRNRNLRRKLRSKFVEMRA